MQVVVQQQFVAMFTFNIYMFPAEDVGPGLRWSTLLQHCISDGESYCFIECMAGVGLGLFRVAFLDQITA